MNKIVRIMAAMVACYCLTQLATAAIKPGAFGTRSAKGKNLRVLNVNAWLIKTTNYGPFVFPEGSTSGGYWAGPGYNYIYGGGLWVGAIDTLDTIRVSMGYDNAVGTSEFGPANPYTWDWSNWVTDSISRVYLSTDSADLAQWPLRDGANEPVVLSDQDGYCTYSDENPAFAIPGGRVAGIRIRQSSYAWNGGFNDDVVYFRFTVVNATSDSLRDVYVGPAMDADIGDESGTAANDRTAFDIARNLAIQFQTDPEAGWPMVGRLGVKYLQTPTNNTGDTVHVIDLTPSHCRDIAPGSQLGMSAFKVLTIALFPSTDSARYAIMQGYDYTTGIMDAYDETGTATPGDKRFVTASGPFHLAAGDSVTLAIAVMVAADSASLLALADSAQAFYDGGLGVAFRPQPVPWPDRPLKLRNSPNPFSLGTALSYELSAPASVTLAVYNVAGQLVKTLVDGQRSAGCHSVRWDGRNDAGQRLSAGVYLYRLQAGDRAMTRKLVLVR